MTATPGQRNANQKKNNSFTIDPFLKLIKFIMSFPSTLSLQCCNLCLSVVLL